MQALIQFLNQNNMAQINEAARMAGIEQKPLDAETKQALETVARLTENHIEDRLSQLASIGKLLVLAGEDETNGIFEQFDLCMVGHFLIDETQTLQEMNFANREANYFLSRGCKAPACDPDYSADKGGKL